MSFVDRVRTAVANIQRSVTRRVRGESASAPATSQPPFARGDRVADCERDDASPMLVVGVMDHPADEEAIPGENQTVAEYNPEYPPDDRVIEVRFFETLDAHLGEWAVEDVLRREANGTLDAGDPYYYPESRLDPASERLEAAASSNQS